NTLSQKLGAKDILSAMDETEMLATLDRLVNSEINELDVAAQTYLRLNGDKLGPIMEEGYRGDMAKALLQSGIALNSINMQDIYMLKKSLDRVSDNLAPDLLQRAIEEGIAVEKLNLNRLSDMATSLNRDGL